MSWQTAKIFNLQHACACRGGTIGVEYQELLHGNGPIRLLDFVQVYNKAVLSKLLVSRAKIAKIR